MLGRPEKGRAPKLSVESRFGRNIGNVTLNDNKRGVTRSKAAHYPKQAGRVPRVTREGVSGSRAFAVWTRNE